MSGDEEDAERADHRVERAVGESGVARVGEPELDVAQPVALGSGARRLQQRRGHVDPDDAARRPHRACRRERRRPRAATEVQHALPRCEPQTLHRRGAEPIPEGERRAVVVVGRGAVRARGALSMLVQSQKQLRRHPRRTPDLGAAVVVQPLVLEPLGRRRLTLARALPGVSRPLSAAPRPAVLQSLHPPAHRAHSRLAQLARNEPTLGARPVNPGRSADSNPGTQKARRSGPSIAWARRVSNLRPLACEASALPLSYAPSGEGRV